MAALASGPITGLVIYLTFSRGSVLAAAIGAACVVGLGRHRWMSVIHAAVATGGTLAVVAVVRGYPSLAEGPGGEGVAATLVALTAAGIVCAFVALLTARLGGDLWQLRPSIARRLALVVAAIAVLVLLVGLADGVPNRVWDRFKEPATGNASNGLESRFGSISGTGRVDNWATALDMFRSEPLRGTGLGTYEFAWNQQARSTAAVQDGHSLYLETLAEGGVVALVLLTLALGGALSVGLRTHMSWQDPAQVGASAGLIGAFVAFLAQASIDWLWESTAVAALGLSAVTIAVAGRSRLREGPVALPVRVGLPLVSCAAIFVMLPSLASTLSVRESQRAARHGDVDAAATSATDAVESRPWAAQPYVQRGLVHELRGHLVAAEADLREAEQRETDNWEIPLLLARVFAEQGKVDRAISAARRARRLRPKALPFR